MDIRIQGDDWVDSITRHQFRFGDRFDVIRRHHRQRHLAFAGEDWNGVPLASERFWEQSDELRVDLRRLKFFKRHFELHRERLTKNTRADETKFQQVVAEHSRSGKGFF